MTEAHSEPLSEGERPLEGRDIALLSGRLLDERRLRDISIFDVGDVLQIADFFVIGTGTSARQLKGTADAVVEKLRALGVRPRGTEGYDRARWILLDCGTVVIHLMDEETRQFYNLELLWGDCPRIPWH